MKTWLIIGLLLMPLSSPAEQRQDRSDQHQEKSKDAKQIPLKPSVVHNAAPPCMPQTRTEASSGKDNSDNIWYKAVSPDTWPNWAVVLAALGAIWVAYRNLRILADQTKATQISADAALLNAQAVIDAERARVVAELVPMAMHYEDPPGWCRLIGGSAVRMSGEEILRGDHLLHRLKFINMGRTVAHVFGYQIHYGFFDWKNGVMNIERIDYNDDFDHRIEGSNSFETGEVVDVNEFVNDPNTEVSTWKTRIVVLVSVTYTHVFSNSEPERDVFRFFYDPRNMSIKRAQATEADRLQCRNGTISPLARMAPDILRNSEGNKDE